MEKMKKISFLELLKDYSVQIPMLQRDYAQGRDNEEVKKIREKFIKSLKEACVEEKELELDFIYGSVENGIFQPIDGQQRLTTLFLLHWYIATKEDKLTDELKEKLNKFSYEVRVTSKYFCIELVNKGIEKNRLENQKISEIIKEHTSWFLMEYYQDPTVKAMLTMLNTIQEEFKNSNGIWDRLSKFITFYLVPMNDFELSDELYIKMNARGKMLTPFEIFKAGFLKLIKEKNYNEIDIESKIDTDWSELIWKYTIKGDNNKSNDNNNSQTIDSNKFDEFFINYFAACAIISYALNEKNIDRISDLNGEPSKLEPSDFLNDKDKNCDPKDDDRDPIKFLTNSLIIYNKDKERHDIKLNITLWDAKLPFEKVIARPTFKNLLLFYAQTIYLLELKNEEINPDAFADWMRVIRNIVENSTFDKDNFISAIKLIKELSQGMKNIYDYLSRNDLKSKFAKEQVQQEKIKAKLITYNPEWRQPIFEAEDHDYFRGDIEFLLYWCNEDESSSKLEDSIPEKFNLDKFKKYSILSQVTFKEGGIIENDEFIFQRALLTKGFYLLPVKGNTYSFLVRNKEKSYSWKKFLNYVDDDNFKDRNNYLKELFDDIDLNSVDKNSVDSYKEKLQEIIDKFSDEENYSYYFIKYHEIIKCCEYSFVYNECSDEYSDKWYDNDFALLSKYYTSCYQYEYYIYSLFLEFELEAKQKTNNVQVDTKHLQLPGKETTKYFEYKNLKIAYASRFYNWSKNFCQDSNRPYVVISADQDWNNITKENVVKYGTREEVLEYLLQL